jgi:hypothetical protein
MSLRSLATLALTIISVASSSAQTTVFQTAEITGSDTQQLSQFGSSLAVSGNTIVVAAIGSSAGPATVYVYVKPASGWGNMQEVAKLTSSDPRLTAFAYVAISGNTIVANSNFNEIHVFVEPQAGWTDMTETAVLTDPAIGLGPCLCGQVAVDADTIAVGSPIDTFGNIGSIEVYVKPSTGWANSTSPNAILTYTGAADEFQAFHSIAISNGTIVGDGVLDTGSGLAAHIFVFTRPASGWNGTYTEQVILSSSQSYTYFGGGQVAISGNTVVASSPQFQNSDNPPGYVDVWVEPASGWSGFEVTETAVLSDGNTSFLDDFGDSVAISGDKIIVGTPAAIEIKPGAHYRGAAYVYFKPTAGWQTTSKPNARLRNSDGTVNDGFGLAVAASGTTTVVGAPDGPKNQAVGSAYVFVK